MHICYGYGIQENIDWKEDPGRGVAAVRGDISGVEREPKVNKVSLECADSHVPLSLIGLLKDKDVLVGAIDVASTDEIESAREAVAGVDQVEAARASSTLERLYPCTNCGMAPLARDIAAGKLYALAAGAALARQTLR